MDLLLDATRGLGVWRQDVASGVPMAQSTEHLQSLLLNMGFAPPLLTAPSSAAYFTPVSQDTIHLQSQLRTIQQAAEAGDSMQAQRIQHPSAPAAATRQASVVEQDVRAAELPIDGCELQPLATPKGAGLTHDNRTDGPDKAVDAYVVSPSLKQSLPMQSSAKVWTRIPVDNLGTLLPSGACDTNVVADHTIGSYLSGGILLTGRFPPLLRRPRCHSARHHQFWVYRRLTKQIVGTLAQPTWPQFHLEVSAAHLLIRCSLHTRYWDAPAWGHSRWAS